MGRANSLRAVTESHDAAYQSEVEQALADRLKAVGPRPSLTQTGERVRQAVRDSFGPMRSPPESYTGALPRGSAGRALRARP